MNIRPKNIVVVGGATGIGLATVKLLLLNNVEHVIVASRNKNKLLDVEKELNDKRVSLRFLIFLWLNHILILLKK